jgi:hypothetical protein
MPKFRKKPVVIDAFQMTRERRVDNSEWPEWLHSAWQLDRETPGSLYPSQFGTSTGTLSIGTLEGPMTVRWDDWIIRGVEGEIYPCKPDIFDKTYNEVKPGVVELGLGKPDGKRSGVAFRMPKDDDTSDTFMFHLGVAMASLYKYEYEKLFGYPPPAGLFRPRFEVPEGLKGDPQVLEAIILSEKAQRRGGNALYDWVQDRIAKAKAKADGVADEADTV